MTMRSRASDAMGRVRVLTQQIASAESDVDLDSLAYGFMASSALFAALELGLFDSLAKKEMCLEELANVSGVPPTRLQTLLTALVASKCLRHSGGCYQNSPNVQQFMVSSSKGYYGDYLKYQIGRLFYARMGQLVPILKGEAHLDYSAWFSDPAVASMYTQAQHNGSLATAKALFKRVNLKGLGIQQMLDVGGGSGAFSLQAVRMGAENMKSVVLELPKVCAEGRNLLSSEASSQEQTRIKFVELDATSPQWPIAEGSQDLVLMSYLCGSVPEEMIHLLYENAWKVLKSGGLLVIHDFMVEDAKDGPLLGALWALQQVTVNPKGLGLTPQALAERMKSVGFQEVEHFDLIARMTKVVMARKP